MAGNKRYLEGNLEHLHQDMKKGKRGGKGEGFPPAVGTLKPEGLASKKLRQKTKFKIIYSPQYSSLISEIQ